MSLLGNAVTPFKGSALSRTGVDYAYFSSKIGTKERKSRLRCLPKGALWDAKMGSLTLPKSPFRNVIVRFGTNKENRSRL